MSKKLEKESFTSEDAKKIGGRVTEVSHIPPTLVDKTETFIGFIKGSNLRVEVSRNPNTPPGEHYSAVFYYNGVEVAGVKNSHYTEVGSLFVSYRKREKSQRERAIREGIAEMNRILGEGK